MMVNHFTLTLSFSNKNIIKTNKNITDYLKQLAESWCGASKKQAMFTLTSIYFSFCR